MRFHAVCNIISMIDLLLVLHTSCAFFIRVKSEFRYVFAIVYEGFLYKILCLFCFPSIFPFPCHKCDVHFFSTLLCLVIWLHWLMPFEDICSAATVQKQTQKKQRPYETNHCKTIIRWFWFCIVWRILKLLCILICSQRNMKLCLRSYACEQNERQSERKR